MIKLELKETKKKYEVCDIDMTNILGEINKRYLQMYMRRKEKSGRFFQALLSYNFYVLGDLERMIYFI